MTTSELQAACNDVAAYAGAGLIGFDVGGLFGAGSALLIVMGVYCWAWNGETDD